MTSYCWIMFNKLCILDAERLLHAVDFLRFLYDVHVVSNCSDALCTKDARMMTY